MDRLIFFNVYRDWEGLRVLECWEFVLYWIDCLELWDGLLLMVDDVLVFVVL